MKKFFINKIMLYIMHNCNYSEDDLIKIEYGLVTIYLNFSKIIIIAVLAYFLGIFKEMIIFMLLFNLLRTTGFGLHATKSWICLISSLFVFILVPYFCNAFVINNYIKIIVGFTGVLLLYKNAPADTKKRPIVNRKRRNVLKLLTTFFGLIFYTILIFINNSFISNCLLFAILLEDFLISPFVYKLFKLPYNNYIYYLKSHPEIKY